MAKRLGQHELNKQMAARQELFYTTAPAQTRWLPNITCHDTISCHLYEEIGQARLSGHINPSRCSLPAFDSTSEGWGSEVSRQH